MIDYGIFYRRCIDVNRIGSELPGFDIFVSAHNSSDRVRIVFEQVRAAKKFWLLHPEYRFSDLEQPDVGVKVRPTELNEIHQVDILLDAIGDIAGKTVC